MNELIDFILKERTDAADWKDDSGQFVSLAREAIKGVVERALEMDDGCLGCGEYPIAGFYTSDQPVAKNNYGPGLYCQECVANSLRGS